jgi:drug/metabolite transporter (DMT)-like permease
MPTSLPPQLIALGAALSYAISGIAARRGMRYSTPITVTLVSVAVHALTLWAAVILTGVCTFPRSSFPHAFSRNPGGTDWTPDENIRG